MQCNVRFQSLLYIYILYKSTFIRNLRHIKRYFIVLSFLYIYSSIMLVLFTYYKLYTLYTMNIYICITLSIHIIVFNKIMTNKVVCKTSHISIKSLHITIHLFLQSILLYIYFYIVNFIVILHVHVYETKFFSYTLVSSKILVLILFFTNTVP